MRDALRRYEILGLRHNLAFLRTLLDREEVRTNRVHTTFLEDQLSTLVTEPTGGIDPRGGGHRRDAGRARTRLRPRARPTGAPLASVFDPFDRLGAIVW